MLSTLRFLKVIKLTKAIIPHQQLGKTIQMKLKKTKILILQQKKIKLS
jgi:hypothetical protein